MSMRHRLEAWLKRRLGQPISGDEFERQRAEILKKTPVPVVWLFGKTGSGKTSIIKYLTGAERAQIGSGFRPETTRSYRYDFPAREDPVLEFLDTRGLGEIDYDPQEDIRQFDAEAHLMIVTVRLRDHALDGIVGPLKKIRRARSDRPILLALTCLHECYPGRQHPAPDPFEPDGDPSAISEDVRRNIEAQTERFRELVDDVVPIDVTRPEDGFSEPNFGGERLKRSFLEHLPEAYRQTYLTLEDVMRSLRSLHERRAMPYVIGAALMAASAAAVPVPWIDIPVVIGIQSDLIRRLSSLYGQRFDAQQFLRMAGAIGGPAVVRQAVREMLKIVPGFGSAANAAMAFAATYALGRGCCWYYGEILAGHAPTKEELHAVINRQATIAKEVWRRTHKGATTAPAQPANDVRANT